MNYRLVVEMNKNNFKTFINELKQVNFLDTRRKNGYHTLIETNDTIFFDLEAEFYTQDESDLEKVKQKIIFYKQYCSIFIFGLSKERIGPDLNKKPIWFLTNKSTSNFDIKSRLVIKQEDNYFDSLDTTIVSVNKNNYLNFKDNLFELIDDMNKIEYHYTNKENQYNNNEEVKRIYYKNLNLNHLDFIKTFNDFNNCYVLKFLYNNSDDYLFLDTIVHKTNDRYSHYEDIELLVDYKKLKKFTGFNKYESKISILNYILSL